MILNLSETMKKCWPKHLMQLLKFDKRNPTILSIYKPTIRKNRTTIGKPIRSQIQEPIMCELVHRTKI